VRPRPGMADLQQPLPPPPPLLSKALTDAVRASTKRAQDGQIIFSPIAALWDEYQQSDTVRKLPLRLRKPMELLCKEIATLATSHFDAYIKGIRPNTHLARAPNPSQETRALPPAVTVPKTYASVTATPTAPSQSPPKTTTTMHAKPNKSAHLPRPDTRLFIRIDTNHPARKAGPFAVFTALKEKLGLDSKLLQEVQEVKSGFALVTGSLEALTALELRAPEIRDQIENCIVERQPLWTTYRLTNIPRTVTTLNGIGTFVSHTVTDQILTEAIQYATKQSITKALETKDSTESGSFHTTWLVSFDTTTHQPLSRTLRILGTSVYSAVLVYKPKTIQCTKCFRWHNARTCVRPQHCRICGSSTHQEEQHSTRCGTTSPHSCPARCLHCGGPHPADYPNCPLRPGKTRKSKAERSAILETTKLARKRACQSANCTERTERTEQPETEPNSSPFTSSFSHTQPSTLRPTTPPAHARNPDASLSEYPTIRRTRFADRNEPDLPRLGPNEFAARVNA
jgi:hypothetical protein